ncbi:MAG: protein-(glutamine-N5) methyltransferase, release factor-specific [Gammaproteobacteria bacterium]|nr:protein-(glutamine-N5) methyltransferase, release factor-specific [Gammaproteobacteria bacterium]|tara:strand:+ start:4257 stop:5114 length:858 start_codon:yes stop_codon:yes gene_type:complete
MKISKILNESIIKISNAIGISKRLSYFEVEHLLMKVLNSNRSYIHAYSDKQLTYDEKKYFFLLLKKRLSGKPLAQILGYQDFYDNKFFINDDVLIPRAETELMLPNIIKYGDSIFSKKNNITVVDAGAGSGCIGLSIAKKRSYWNVICIENSIKAIKVLQLNNNKLKLKNTSIIKSDWLLSVKTQSVDIIISNPPYVASNSKEIDDNVKTYEPSYALYAGIDGLSSLSNIIKQSKRVLNKNGYLFLENGYNQSEEVRKMLKKYNYKDINVMLDYNNIERFTISQR